MTVNRKKTGFILCMCTIISFKASCQIFERGELDNLCFDSSNIIKQKISNVTIEFKAMNDSSKTKIYYNNHFGEDGKLKFLVEVFENKRNNILTSDTSWFNGLTIHDCSFPYPEGYLIKKICNSHGKIQFADNASCKTLYEYDLQSTKILDEYKSCLKSEGSNEVSKISFRYNKAGHLTRVLESACIKSSKCSLDSIKLPPECYNVNTYYLIEFGKNGLVFRIRKYLYNNKNLVTYLFYYNNRSLVSSIHVTNKELAKRYIVSFKYN